jgi:hypothetical protein
VVTPIMRIKNDHIEDRRSKMERCASATIEHH